jgi:hypothetical protein
MSLWSSCDEVFGEKPRGLGRFADVCAAVVAVVGFLRLADCLWNAGFGLDQVLFGPDFDATTSLPNRMAPNTAVSLVLLGLALRLRRIELGQRFRPSQYLSIGASSVALSAIIGYTFGAVSLYRVGSFNPMALETALLLVLLSLGVLFCSRARIEPALAPKC